MKRRGDAWRVLAGTGKYVRYSLGVSDRLGTSESFKRNTNVGIRRFESEVWHKTSALGQSATGSKLVRGTWSKKHAEVT